METEKARETKTTLVLGGTGKTGRRVVERLKARGLPVRVGSRSGELPFDWGDEATWVPALQNVRSVYVSYFPDLAVPGAEAIGEISRAAGREIRYVPVSVEQYSSMLAEHEVPAEFVALLTYLFTEVLDGRNAHLTDGVWRALGREPKDFADYARDVAATGIWDDGR